MNEIKIETATNGWILRFTEEEFEQTVVFSYSLDNESETFIELLYFIKDIVGPAESRYSKKRITITTEPGDKYEGE